MATIIFNFSNVSKWISAFYKIDLFYIDSFTIYIDKKLLRFVMQRIYLINKTYFKLFLLISKKIFQKFIKCWKIIGDL
jgi:hypothetical protein